MGDKYIKGDKVYEKSWLGDKEIGTIKDTGWCGGKEVIPTNQPMFSGDDPHWKLEDKGNGNIEIRTRSSYLNPDKESGFTINTSEYTRTQTSTDWERPDYNGSENISRNSGSGGRSSSNSYSSDSYESSSGSYSSSNDYSNDASTANPAAVFFKVIGALIFIIILISMCDKGSNTRSTQIPRPATQELPQSAPKENTAPPQELKIKETKQHSSGESTLQRRNAGVEQQHMDRKKDPDYFDPSGL